MRIEEYLHPEILLRIPARSPWILLLLFPPVYFLWIWQIGRQSSRAMNKKSRLFDFISIFSFTSWFVVFFAIETRRFDQLEYLLPTLIILSYYMSVYAAIRMIKLEYKDEDRIPGTMEYFSASMQIIVWFLGLWYIQPRLNKIFGVIST